MEKNKIIILMVVTALMLVFFFGCSISFGNKDTDQVETSTDKLKTPESTLQNFLEDLKTGKPGLMLTYFDAVVDAPMEIDGSDILDASANAYKDMTYTIDKVTIGEDKTTATAEITASVPKLGATMTVTFQDLVLTLITDTINGKELPQDIMITYKDTFYDNIDTQVIPLDENVKIEINLVQKSTGWKIKGDTDLVNTLTGGAIDSYTDIVSALTDGSLTEGNTVPGTSDNTSTT